MPADQAQAVLHLQDGVAIGDHDCAVALQAENDDVGGLAEHCGDLFLLRTT